MRKNKWYIITGAPCSGKTTMLEILQARGHDVIFEVARLYIDQELAKGKTLQEIRSDELLFQKKVLEMKINLEKELSPDKLVLFERGIPDSHAYYKLFGSENDPFLEEAMQLCRYHKVFLLEPLDYKLDYARTESSEQQKLLHQLLEEGYQKINAQIIKVPVLGSKDERADFIINNL
jgi:predicted ATPase